ncbi:TrbG/VirB9 family P-type conjugative transfer protein [Thermus caldilimi]|uniref:TrbG/VirB9 family P-type conjugative transfer protein n=1 Tax=Thermus caldilimi TaxID=2483360 RepID=UPI001F0F8573|nr:TrbG/VirB9 family P-type conjugative transfer protein [Thermus caldilimi]
MRVLGWVLALWSIALAQLGPYVERIYDVRDLMTRPGIVVLTPGFLTVVDVDEQVEQAVSARSDLFELRVFGNSIYLRPTKRAGTTDLVVTAGGRVFMLRLVIDERSFSTYRYRVRYPKADNPEPPLPEQKSAASRAASSPVALPVQGEFTVTRAGEGLLLEYRIYNAGRDPVILDTARLSLRGAGGPYSFRLLWREGAAVPGRLMPGETERGALLVEKGTPPLELTWTATVVGSGREVMLSQRWGEVK